VIVDASQKMSAIGIFDVIFASQFPARNTNMSLVFKLDGTIAEKGKHNLSVELRDEKSNKLAEFRQDLEFQPPPNVQGKVSAQVIMRMQNLPFQTKGQYEFVIFVDDRFLGRVPLTIQQLIIKATGNA
jgi:hypothetical protein